MLEVLLKEFPTGFATLKEFSEQYPQILSVRRARNSIATLASQPPAVQKIYRKRFGRWFIHIPSLVAYMEDETPIPRQECSHGHDRTP